MSKSPLYIYENTKTPISVTVARTEKNENMAARYSLLLISILFDLFCSRNRPHVAYMILMKMNFLQTILCTVPSFERNANVSFLRCEGGGDIKRKHTFTGLPPRQPFGDAPVLNFEIDQIRNENRIYGSCNLGFWAHSVKGLRLHFLKYYCQ